jgi:hypothetical protein
MDQEGEVFYYKNNRPTRPAVRQPAGPPKEAGRELEAALTERLARLEAVVVRLEEAASRLEELSGQVGPEMEEGSEQ